MNRGSGRGVGNSKRWGEVQIYHLPSLPHSEHVINPLHALKSLQDTGEKQVRIAWSTIKLPNGATQDDNHAGRDPMNLSPYACSGLTTRKNNRNEKINKGDKYHTA